jgi:alpha-mannosidase
MPSDPSFDTGRFERFAQDVLAPAVFSNACPLDASVHQCTEPIPFAQAADAAYQPVTIGWEWGPVWSTAWFRVRGSVPRALAGRAVALRIATGTEALLWRSGEPRHGLDLNRDAVLLFPRAIEGESVDVMIEAACNHHLGQLGTHWDPAEFLARWKSEKPGKLARCELAAYDETAWRLHRSYVFAMQLMRELPKDGARSHELAGALRRATKLIDERRFAQTAPAALRVVEAALQRRAGGSAPICHAVGHAHIDTAWLWPIRETKRKCLRTFATALANLERFPEFRFLCSQAQQYAWVEESAPDLFARIRERIEDGRWEPGGAMWIESDCNLVSGESLVRQILHGTRYWRSRFGEKGRQRYLYLPDTFGFTAALPQIMRLSGLDTFITHKLSWNQVNRWPHTHFVWRGLDGSEVLAHQMPGHDYNLLMSPRELRRGEQNHDNKDLPGVVIDDGESAPARYLQPFGYGDGGGGPTDWQILNGQLASDCDGVPRVRFGRVDEFCAALHADREIVREAGEDFPSWEGELYLEAHRGTYTTQAAIKLANRRAEDGLRSAEILTWAGPSAPDAGDMARSRDELDAAWKLTLLNQFHDIIPGSSIGWVYEDAADQFAKVREAIDAHTKAAMERLGPRMNTAGHAKPLMVFNATSASVSGVVEHASELVYAADVPALGVRVIDAARASERLPETGPARFAGELRLANGIIEADFDSSGSLRSLRRIGGPELCAPGREMGGLVLYDDHPRHWDAWDIDPEYELKPTPIEFRADGIQIDSFGPLRAKFSRRAKIGARSSIIQEIVLDAGSPRLDVRTTVDWHESHRLLRALFPTGVRAARATYDCAFGYLQRSTGRNTSFERAAFEVPAHRWIDLSDDAGGMGLAVLNDCKYGHSCLHGVIGMSLLRAPKFPDEAADMGMHRFAYSMMPHDGDWRAAGVDDQADLLNTPLLGWALHGAAGGAGSGDLGAAWAPVSVGVEGQARVSVSALKVAEEDDRLILRFVETRGRRGVVSVRWNLPVRDIQPVDLLEQPMVSGVEEHDMATATTKVRISPFQIVTLAARRA